jgi:hypothetical protein
MCDDQGDQRAVSGKMLRPSASHLHPSRGDLNNGKDTRAVFNTPNSGYQSRKYIHRGGSHHRLSLQLKINLTFLLYQDNDARLTSASSTTKLKEDSKTKPTLVCVKEDRRTHNFAFMSPTSKPKSKCYLTFHQTTSLWTHLTRGVAFTAQTILPSQRHAVVTEDCEWQQCLCSSSA